MDNNPNQYSGAPLDSSNPTEDAAQSSDPADSPAVSQLNAEPTLNNQSAGYSAPANPSFQPPLPAAQAYQNQPQQPYQGQTYYQPQPYQPQPNYQPQPYQPQPNYQPQQQYPVQAPYQTQQPVYYVTYTRHPAQGKATASLVLGIISIVFSWMSVLAVISVICSIIGMILAVNARKELPPEWGRGTATAGLVCSIIGLVFAVLVIALFVIVLSVVPYISSTVNL
jgi:hypothetical protein